MDAIMLSRADLEQTHLLTEKLQHVGAVVHLAAINRHARDSEILTTNVQLAHNLAVALEAIDHRVTLVHGNSIHCGDPSAFGQSKLKVRELFHRRLQGHTFVDVLLPNLFGEHGVPNYNSFVATFCHALVNGREPTVFDDREVPLLHAQDAADILIEGCTRETDGDIRPTAESHLISDILGNLKTYGRGYADGEVPDTSSVFKRALFNTFRSYLVMETSNYAPQVHADSRGSLFEAIRANGGPFQAFASHTQPGQTRGQHFHRRKFERFVVLEGSASITMRRLFGTEIRQVSVGGSQPTVVDMPTLWAHAITNVGDSDLITLFLTDSHFDHAAPDTYPEVV